MTLRRSTLPVVFSCVGHAFMHLFTAFYFVIVLALEVDWQLPYHELAPLWALGALFVGLFALPSGWLGDRWSASGMMLIYFLGLGAAGMFCAFVDGPTALVVGLTAIGLFSAIYHPVGIPWIVQHAESPGIALGINGAFGGLGVALAGLVAGGLIDLASWRAAFFVPGAVVFAIGLLLLAALLAGWIDWRVPLRARPSGSEAPSSRQRLGVALILLTTMLIAGIVFQAVQVAMPKLFDIRLREVAGAGLLGIGSLIALVYGLGAIIQVVGGRLADRYPLKGIYVLGLALQVPVLVAIALAAGWPLLLVAALTVVLSAAILPAENLILSRYAPAKHQGLSFGMKYVVAFGTGPLAIWLSARTHELSGEFVWLFVGLGLGAVVAVGAAALLPSGRSPAPVAVPAE